MQVKQEWDSESLQFNDVLVEQMVNKWDKSNEWKVFGSLVMDCNTTPCLGSCFHITFEELSSNFDALCSKLFEHF